ncbi:MAG: hypothetical protein V2B19_15895 [Pseudomonadota bacterium]
MAKTQSGRHPIIILLGTTRNNEHDRARKKNIVRSPHGEIPDLVGDHGKACSGFSRLGGFG